MKARANYHLSMIFSRWYYGMNLGQSYEISNNQGEWCFSEELAGRKCSCTLRIVGSWVASHRILLFVGRRGFILDDSSPRRLSLLSLSSFDIY